MKFMLVRDRTPSPQSYCAFCCEAIDAEYLREVATRLAYCDRQCFALHCELTDRDLKKYAMAGAAERRAQSPKVVLALPTERGWDRLIQKIYALPLPKRAMPGDRLPVPE